jgi:hypothetical protein
MRTVNVNAECPCLLYAHELAATALSLSLSICAGKRGGRASRDTTAHTIRVRKWLLCTGIWNTTEFAEVLRAPLINESRLKQSLLGG